MPVWITDKEVPIISTDNNVLIVWHGVSVPLGYITLIRDKNNYGAVKFTKNWIKEWRFLIGSTKREDIFASYESYYQADSTGDFTKKNVIIHKGEVSYKIRLSIFGLISGHPYWTTGDSDIRCGRLKLNWDGFNGINYLNFEQLYNRKSRADYEFAPTKWTDFSEVKVFDSRLEWFKCDEHRDDIVISINKLWEGEEQSRKLK
jgi:hypothetical protein